MDTCTMKIEVTAFRNDNDNGLESISASIGVPIESNREVIRKIDVEQEGSMPYEHRVCAGTDDDDYSDVFLTESDVVSHEISYK